MWVRKRNTRGYVLACLSKRSGGYHSTPGLSQMWPWVPRVPLALGSHQYGHQSGIHGDHGLLKGLGVCSWQAGREERGVGIKRMEDRTGEGRADAKASRGREDAVGEGRAGGREGLGVRVHAVSCSVCTDTVWEAEPHSITRHGPRGGVLLARPQDQSPALRRLTGDRVTACPTQDPSLPCPAAKDAGNRPLGADT